MTDAVTASSTYAIPFATIIPGGPWQTPGTNYSKPYKIVNKSPGLSSLGQDILYIDGTWSIGPVVTPAST